MIRSFINFIKVEVYSPNTAPPSFDNKETVTDYLFYGDGRGDKETKDKEVSLEVLYAYKNQCMAQFAIANMCIRQMELNNMGNTEAEYKDGEVFRIIHTNGNATYVIGDKFIVQGSQKLKRGESVKGIIAGRKSTYNMLQTDIIQENKK